MASLFGKKRKRNVKTSSFSPPTVDDPNANDDEPVLETLNDNTTNNNIDNDESKFMTTSFFDTTNHQDKQEQEKFDSSTSATDEFPTLPAWASFSDLGLAEPLVNTCRSLGFARPTPVQRTLIPFLLRNQTSHVLALASTGSGKTAAFLLPILHHLADDPYGIFCVVVTPTRELAKQIHQQVLALGSAYKIQSALVVGGLDSVQQSLALDQRPHVCVATPGRLAELLRGPNPPKLDVVRYLVLDEADRLLAANSGFERDVAELLLHTRAVNTNRKKRNLCQTLLFSATMTRSLETMEELAGAGQGRLPLQKFVISEDNHHQENEKVSKVAKKPKTEGLGDADTTDGTALDPTEEEAEQAPTTPRIPAGLKQEYIFMPSRVRDAYLLTTIRTLMINGGRKRRDNDDPKLASRKRSKGRGAPANNDDDDDEDDDEENQGKARSAIVFVSTCERAALVSGILDQVGVDNVALHSLLSQNRRLAALAKFKSEQVRVLVATDVASRGLDIPTVDLVINSELPRHTVSYVHRVGRTARAGRRGRAVSLVAESDVALVHAAERWSGRPLTKCMDVTDDMAIRLLGPVTKAARLAKMKLMEIGFDELVRKFKERKARDRKERERIERALQRSRKEALKSNK